MKAKHGLGKGLDALFTTPRVIGPQYREVGIDKVAANQQQPRRTFDDEGIAQLAASIGRQGILQPLIVREKDGGYEIIVGERRWRAARQAGLTMVPVVIRNVDDVDALEFGLVENVHRQDLNPMEEATAYKMLLEMRAWTQQELADKLGKDRSSVSNLLRLLGLPVEVKNAVRDGRLSVGHAKALLAVKNLEQQIRLSRLVMERGMSVRQTEELVRRFGAERKKTAAGRRLDPLLFDLQERLKRSFQTKVDIVPGKKKGKIVFEYYSTEDLNRLLELLDIL
ncbi:ParB/RepB/Spo0J family partition protein [bacterium]|nr:ParB/RepB/Spo0J family partition protein [candidate division CSSED10-310 bacterium]